MITGIYINYRMKKSVQISTVTADLRDKHYEEIAAVIQQSPEYQSLKSICESGSLTEEHYIGLYNFIEKQAAKFWKYFLVREAGKKDEDKIRAVTVVEYCRLLEKLVANHPKFQEKIAKEVARQYPKEYGNQRVFSPSELVVSLEECNLRDYVNPELAAGRTRTDSTTQPTRDPQEDLPDFSALDEIDEEDESLTTVRPREEADEDQTLPQDLNVSLRIIKGMDERKEITISETPAFIGRDPLTAIKIRHKTVSRQHAVIFYQNHRFHIKDLDSTNGTLLNSKPVKESPIKDGDIIQLGDVTCQFNIEGNK